MGDKRTERVSKLISKIGELIEEEFRSDEDGEAFIIMNNVFANHVAIMLVSYKFSLTEEDSEKYLYDFMKLIRNLTENYLDNILNSKLKEKINSSRETMN